MPETGIIFDKKSKPLTKRILNFFEKVRHSYLSAKENKSEYAEDWKDTVEYIKGNFDGLDTFTTEMKKYVKEELLYGKEVNDPESNSAKDLFLAIKHMRFKSDKVSDPFSEQLGEKVINTFLKNDGIFVAFIHYALRSHANTLPSSAYEEHDLTPDTITQGVMGLDLLPKDIPIYITEHYGDDKDTTRIKPKFDKFYKLFKKVFLEKYDEGALENIIDLDISKADKNEELSFLVPNKPMYRIFEIEDLHEIKGLSGDFVVQEKYDGMRIQIHKKGDEITIYSFNQKDITNKCKDQVTELKKKKYGNCILDAELMLFVDDEPYDRADTITHVFHKETKGRLRAHVFDIMKHENKDLLDIPLRERINILFYQYSQHSSDELVFPSKKDTRLADSIAEVGEYSLKIMEMPTSEGVVIKDAESTYYRGIRKNPKWIKWKKFVDLDVIVLDKKKTKSNLHSYTMGIGPLSEEEAEEYQTIKIDNKEYLPVGKALNTKKSVEIGSIIRVKVDEVKRSKKGYSLYSAKLHEIPEVESPDKLQTLEQLSKKTKKALVNYTIGAVKEIVGGIKKAYTITDSIHGEATIILKSELDGFTVYGFEGDKLMQKNALVDIDLWKEDMLNQLKKNKADVKNKIIHYIRERNNKPMALTDVLQFMVRENQEDFERIFDSDKNTFYKWLLGQDGFNVAHKKLVIDELENPIKKGENFDAKLISVEEDLITKDNDTFKIFRRKDENLDFIMDINGEVRAWTINIDNDEDIYNLFGKSGKFPAIVSEQTDEYKLLDKGELILGLQKHGYHEYKIIGDKFETRIHFRVIPVDEKKSWLVWTGKKQKMLELSDNNKDLWDIKEDKYANLKILS
tara:strand:- start:1733 stop:4291 length:2559 start_codon:yes stop_codon:yes gene_type:complete